jgi:hypothetical protein
VEVLARLFNLNPRSTDEARHSSLGG